jgi:hypothetical protein
MQLVTIVILKKLSDVDWRELCNFREKSRIGKRRIEFFPGGIGVRRLKWKARTDSRKINGEGNWTGGRIGNKTVWRGSGASNGSGLFGRKFETDCAESHLGGLAEDFGIFEGEWILKEV